MIKAVFLDVANTLLFKPDVLPAIEQVLFQADIHVIPQLLATRHKLLSEVITFPDKTNKDFYTYFNSELLLQLGIIPTDKLIQDIYLACRSLTWSAFPDVHTLSDIPLPLGVGSNWDRSLPDQLKQHLNIEFEWILGSEELGVKKPDPAFFQRICEASQLAPEEIIFVGDSIRLDIAPALEAGMKGILLDRKGLYMPYRGIQTISQLGLIKNHI